MVLWKLLWYYGKIKYNIIENYTHQKTADLMNDAHCPDKFMPSRHD